MQDVRKFFVIGAVVAAAAIPYAASAAQFGGEVFGAYNTYSMGDVNDALPTGADELSGGLTGGIGLRMWASPQFMLSGVWEPLFLETEDSSGDKHNLDANSFQVSGGYFFPSTTNSKYGIGAGVGYYTIGGETPGPGGSTLDVEGSGVGFHFLGMGEWTMSPGFGVTAGAGYRIADIEIDNAGGATADYSGFMGRLGVAFYMPTK